MPLSQDITLTGTAPATFAEREEQLLAPYAMHSVHSRGRKQPESDHPYRGPFQRDRDRILHCAAYRRLSGKMQVFAGHMGDYHRTRLTHTQEVASIARTIGRALRLNEDLIEALALLHDIGHPPYGHAGEDALNGCLSSRGGFCHNRQALTIAEELEVRYISRKGLNLSHEVLAGQTSRARQGADDAPPLLEVQVVDAADSITYDAHDTDDAVKLGLVTLEELSELQLIGDLFQRVQRQSSDLGLKLQRKAVVHAMIELQVSDVIAQTAKGLAAVSEPTSHDTRLVQHSDGIARQKSQLESFLHQHVYRHPDLIEVRRLAQRRLEMLFEHLCREPQELPSAFRSRADDVGLPRSVGDYLAGMTDRYCDQQFTRVFGPGQGDLEGGV